MPYQKSSVGDPGRGKSLSGFEYCHQYSNTTGESPSASEIKPGEIAINAADAVIYHKKPNGQIGSIPAGINAVVTIGDIVLGVDRQLTFVNGVLASVQNV